MTKNKIKTFNGKAYTVRKPSLIDYASMIDNITDSVFNDGAYAPYLFEPAFKVACVAFFTDAELPMISENGKDVIDFINSYSLIEGSGIMDELDGIIDEAEVKESARELIEYRKNVHLNKSKADNLLVSLTLLSSKISNFVDTLDVAAKKGFDGIDIKELFGALKQAASKDESEIVSSVLNFQEKNKKNG